MASRMTNEQIIEVWKTMVDVQLHFSQMEMTTRNTFVTIAIAIIAGVGLSIQQDISVSLGVAIPAATILSMMGILVTWLFYFVDRYWYHRFLIGTGDAIGPIEAHLSSISPAPIELGAKIGARSPLQVGLWRPLRWITWFAAADDPRDVGGALRSRYVHLGRLHSEAKISVFYKAMMLLFFAMAVTTFLAG